MMKARKLIAVPFLLMLAIAIALIPVSTHQDQHASAASASTIPAATNKGTSGCPGITPKASTANPTLPYRFDFGTGAAASGYTKVLPTTAYSASRGYGFASTANLTAVSRGGPDLYHGDFITSSKPFTFNTDLQNGNYNVTVSTGDNAGSSATTVKAEYGRIALNKLTTTAGHFITQTFSVNVADGQLNLEFNWTSPKIDGIEIAKANAVTIFLAGDSTVCDQNPLADPYVSYGGWGQALTMYFKPGVSIANYAASGRTSISFIHQGKLNDILKVIKPNDFLFIQFGHNDEHSGSGSSPFTTYKAALQQYIDGARAHGAIPVLVTPVARRSFDSSGKIQDTHGNYPVAMRQLAAADKVQLIDLTALSMAYFQTLGPIGTKSVFCYITANQTPDFPNAVSDNTHMQINGAILVAKLVTTAIKNQNIQPLANYLL